MREAPALGISQTLRRQWCRCSFAARLVGCFLFVGSASVFVGLAPESTPIRIANGVLLAYLLLTPRWRWLAYAAAGLAAMTVAGALFHEPWQASLAFNGLNIIEVFIAALLLRSKSSQLPCFTELPYLLKFVGFAMVLAPVACGGLLAAFAALVSPHSAPASVAINWAAGGLGMAVAAPACVAVLRAPFLRSLRIDWNWLCLLPLGFITLAGFAQTRLPMLYLIYPCLILILFRMGMGWAAASTLFVAWAGSWCTMHGLGPFATFNSFAPFEPALLIQVFVATGIVMIYSIFMVLEKQRKTMMQLEKIAALHALLSECSRDAIVLADFSGHRSYVSASAEHINGWKPEELLTKEGLERVHPEDRARVQKIIRELNSGSEGAMIEIRVCKQDGEYVWVEASLRAVYDTHTHIPSGVLNVIRDITERKHSEQKLQDAYNAVEALAITDALTGLANRRRFDQYLSTEWRRAMRDRQPLSLLMIDADFFKLYNDTYGHTRGDSCLRQIAEACMDVVSRPGDLVARFGGEEFVIVLPNTDNEGAMKIGNEVCESLRSRHLLHSGNPFGIATISIGCATMTPKFGKHAPDLLEMADQALYKAKQSGRNKVCNGNTMTETESAAAHTAIVSTA